jgi:hypothetical protein
MAYCDTKRVLAVKPSDDNFIDECMHARYSSNPYPCYQGFLSTKNKSLYLGLALEIYKNAKNKGYINA